MKHVLREFLFTSFLVSGLSISLKAQTPPSIEWQKCLGGSESDGGGYIIPVSTGFVIAGATFSDDGDVSNVYGKNDYWVAKTDSNGIIEWEKNYGGTQSDYVTFTKETPDGGYLIGGDSFSKDIDVTGHHGTISSEDYWIIKIDSIGNLQWSKSLGSGGENHSTSADLSIDGGYYIGGFTYGEGGDISVSYGNSDYWIVKVDSVGSIVWEKTFGGTISDEANKLVTTPDGGCIVVGYSSSNDIDVTNNHGGTDYWVIKLNAEGTKEWANSYGGSYTDVANDVLVLSDGYLIAGTTQSNDGDVFGYHGDADYWIVKIDLSGNILWSKAYGGSWSDACHQIIPFADGGFLLGGTGWSMDGDATFTYGLGDYWIIRTDDTGNLIWQKSYGGSNAEYFGSMSIVDNGYILAGSTLSNDGDVSGNHGGSDLWLVKLEKDFATSVEEITDRAIAFEIFPNPFSSQTTITFSLEKSDELKIQLFDFTGRKIKTIAEGNYPKGNHQLLLAKENLAAGIYLLRGSMNSQTITQKIIIQ